MICLGNELVRDDGVGIRVGRVLRRLELPEHVTVELRRTVGLELVEELRPDEAIVIVDAGQTGRAPGTCTVLELDEAADLAQTPYCCHGVGISEVLTLARKLFPDRMPLRAAVVVIEGVDFESYEMTLTAEVEAALPEAVAVVLRTIGAPGALEAAGRVEAERWKGWSPSITDLAEG